MLCLRCTRRAALAPVSALAAARPTSSLLSSITLRPQQPIAAAAAAAAAKTQPAQRTFASYSNIRSTFATSKRPSLPSTAASSLSLATTLESPGATNSLLPLPASTSVSGPGSLLQTRGPKRDTFDPSHRVRKRRHGFLSRLRTRNGRNLLTRRRLKRRSTLGH